MKREPVILIVNALIWGGVIIGCSWALRDTEAYQEIQNILALGAILSLLTVGGGLLGKKKDSNQA